MTRTHAILRNLLVNVDPKGRFPARQFDGPLIIDVPMLERIEDDEQFAGKLQGWKGDILWTTGAMHWMVENKP